MRLKQVNCELNFSIGKENDRMDTIDIAKITPSEKEYLKAIYHLGCFSDHHYIRPIDIATYLGVSRPSVTKACKRLEQSGMINRPMQQGIIMTEKGFQVAETIMRRFSIIKSFLENIFTINGETAEKDAWNIERVIGSQSVDKMNQFLNKSKVQEKA